MGDPFGFRQAALRVAVEKFGPLISFDGSDEYKAAMVDIAVRTGICVDFNDAELNRRYAEGIVAAAAGRRYLVRGAGTKTPDRQPAPTPGPQHPTSRTHTRTND